MITGGRTTVAGGNPLSIFGLTSLSFTMAGPTSAQCHTMQAFI